MNNYFLFFLLIILTNTVTDTFSQTVPPTTKKRTVGVKPSSKLPATESKSAESKSENKSDKQETTQAENERIAAGLAALEREKQRAVAEAEARLKAEMESLRLQAEEEKRALAKQLEEERQQKTRELEEIQQKIEEEKLLQQQRLAEAQKQAEQEKIEKEKSARELQQVRQEVENQARLLQAQAEQEKKERVRLRSALIEMIAKRLKFLKPEEAFTLIPTEIDDAVVIEQLLQKAILQNPRLTTKATFCDGDFVGSPLNVMLSANPTLGAFLNELSSLFDVNFLPDPEILEFPVAGDVRNVPWDQVLRIQLNYLDLEAQCLNENTIAITKRSKLQTRTEADRKRSPLKTEFIKLKYLQPVVGGQVNVAGRMTGGANTLESLEAAITKILRADGDNRGSVSRIPGRNEFIITATEEQLVQIRQVIARADRPAYQVVIYASIVTANENKLREIGGQFSGIGGTSDLNLLGGLTNFNSNRSNSTDNQNQGNQGNLTPGGVRSLGTGFNNPPSGGITFGISNIFGTTQLAMQLNFLAQKGVVKIDNRPSIIVVDGQTADLQIGRQVAIPVQSIGTVAGGTTELQILNAGNTLNVTPQVIEDEKGNAVAVNLLLRIESNEVDTTVVSQGIPSIIRRATQTSLMLNTSQTAVIGGFSTDAETNSESKTPGLGDLPVFGSLFKRKIKAKNSDRLYFAIRVEVVPQGEIITTLPLNIDPLPQLPNPKNEFFRPYNEVPKKSNPNE